MILCLAVTIGFRDTKRMGNASGKTTAEIYNAECLARCPGCTDRKAVLIYVQLKCLSYELYESKLQRETWL